MRKLMRGTAKLKLLLRVGAVVLCREMSKVKRCWLGGFLITAEHLLAPVNAGL